MIRQILQALLVLAALLVCPTARASVVFTLNADGCSGGCGNNGQNTTNNNFGSIQLTDNGAGTVSVVVTLNGAEFENSIGQEAIAFVLPSLPSLSITNISAGYSQAAGSSFAMAPFGSGGSPFNEAIHCNACASSPQPGPLSFTVSATGLTWQSFQANGNGYSFAADVIGLGLGRTGDVGSNTAPVIQTPEPATAGMLASAGALFGIVSLISRHRFRVTVGNRDANHRG
jgi:hypothetical protein